MRRYKIIFGFMFLIACKGNLEDQESFAEVSGFLIPTGSSLYQPNTTLLGITYDGQSITVLSNKNTIERFSYHGELLFEKKLATVTLGPNFEPVNYPDGMYMNIQAVENGYVMQKLATQSLLRFDREFNNVDEFSISSENAFALHSSFMSTRRDTGEILLWSNFLTDKTLDLNVFDPKRGETDQFLKIQLPSKINDVGLGTDKEGNIIVYDKIGNDFFKIAKDGTVVERFQIDFEKINPTECESGMMMSLQNALNEGSRLIVANAVLMENDIISVIYKVFQKEKFDQASYIVFIKSGEHQKFIGLKESLYLTFIEGHFLNIKKSGDKIELKKSGMKNVLETLEE
jgi:hypothetical protein